MAYVTQQRSTESQSTYKRRLYNTLYYMCREATEPKEMITKLWPQTASHIVWKNLGEAPVPGTTKAAWYKVIRDTLPTNTRLLSICMVHTDVCRKCDRTDTLTHCLIECGEGEHIWTWTRQRLAWILRTIPELIPSDWLLRPHFTLWPPKRRRAVLWILANLILFRTQQRRELTLQHFIDFMKRSKWKLCQSHKGKREWGTAFL